jgi:hypothetical protein
VEIRGEDRKLRFLIDDKEVNNLELRQSVSSRVGFHFTSGEIHLANLRLSEQKLPDARKRKPPADAAAFAGKRFKVITRSATWHGAQEMCRLLDVHLAVVRDQADNQFLTSLLKVAGLKAAWLGATDAKTEGQWVWADGTRVKNPTYWDKRSGQPDNEFGLAHYLVLSVASDGNGTWSDERDESPHGFICEWDY